MNKEELFYSETLRRTQEQYSARQHFDTVTMALLGVGGIVLSTMVATVSHWACWSIYPAVVVISSFLALAFFTIKSLQIRKWQFQPSLAHLEANIKSGKYDDETMLIWSGEFMAKAIENNKQWLKYKANCLRASYIILAVEVLALGVLVFSAST